VVRAAAPAKSRFGVGYSLTSPAPSWGEALASVCALHRLLTVPGASGGGGAGAATSGIGHGPACDIGGVAVTSSHEGPMRPRAMCLCARR